MTAKGFNLLVCVLFLSGPVLSCIAGPTAPAEPILSGLGPLSEPMARATPYLKENSSAISMGNDLTEIVISKATAGIDKVIDRSSGTDLRSNKVPPAMMFMVQYWNGTGLELAIQWDAKTITYTNTTNGPQVTLTISFSMLKDRNINVTVTIVVKDADPLAKFRMSITNDEPYQVRYAYFPIIWGVGKIGAFSTDDSMFYPMGDGLVIHDPVGHQADLDLSEIYPSSVPVQLMAVYDNSICGLYMGATDVNARPKAFHVSAMEWSASKHLALQLRHLFSGGLGNDPGMDYDAVIGTFHGDWYDAAAMYRSWAMTTPFVSGGEVFSSKDTPSWWMNTTLIQMVNKDDPSVTLHPLSEIVNVTRSFSKMTALNTTVVIHGWEKNGAWVGPNYYPPSEGNATFKKAMADLKVDTGAGADRGAIYISGTVWRVNRTDIGYQGQSYFDDEGLPWVALDENGQPTFDAFYESLGWHSARMDLQTTYWQDMVKNNLNEGIGLGTSMVQIDEFPIGSAYPCYNSSHGHEIGYASGDPTYFSSMRAQARALNKDIILSTEEPSEVYIRAFDTYVSRDNAPEALLYGAIVDKYGDDAEFIPFFSFIYHSNITAFGEHLILTDDYPEAYSDSIARGLARTLVQGELMNGVGGPMNKVKPRLRELYNRTSRAVGTYANEYLIQGTPLIPPTISAPKKEVQWYNYYTKKAGTPVHEPTVMGSSWKADDGGIGLVLVNWDTVSHTFDLTIPAYDLAPANYSVLMTKNGVRSVLVARMALPGVINMTLDKNDVALLELVQLPDITAQNSDITLQVGPPLGKEEVRIGLTVHNRGTKGAGQFQVAFYVDGTGKPAWEKIGDNRTVSGLAVDASTEVDVIWNTTGLIGAFNLTAVADGADTVLELNENNNSARTTFTLLPRPKSDLVVRVLDNSTGLPLNGVNVTLNLSATPAASGLWNLTDASGLSRFTELDAGRYKVFCFVNKYHSNNTTVELEEGKTIELVVTLDRADYYLKVTGTVFDNSTNETLYHVNITLTDTENAVVVGETLTNVSGQYVLWDPPYGDYVLTAARTGYYLKMVDISIIPSSSLYQFNFRLDAVPVDPLEGNITGYVHDADTGLPIKGATVVTASEPYKWTMTDDDGFYILLKLDPGQYAFYAFLEPTYDASMGEVKLEPRQTAWLNFTLKKRVNPPPMKPGVIMGNVTDQYGLPVPGAKVQRINHIINISTYTDSKGHYEFRNLTQGTYVFKISAEGYMGNQTHAIYVGLDMVVTVNIQITRRPEVPPNDPPNDTLNNAICIGSIGATIGICIILLAYWSNQRKHRPKLQYGPPMAPAVDVPLDEDLAPKKKSRGAGPKRPKGGGPDPGAKEGPKDLGPPTRIT